MPKEGLPMQIARTDRGPCIIDQHQFGVDVDVLANARAIAGRDSHKREVLMLTKRGKRVKQLFVLWLSSPSADPTFRLGRQENNDLNATLQSALEARYYCGNSKSLVLDIN